MGRDGDRSPAEPIGRTPELGVLAGLLDRVASGSTASLVVEGLAGEGKSCLLEWTARVARDRGFTLVRATGVEFERELAFAALRAVLRPFQAQVEQLEDWLMRALRAAMGWEEGMGMADPQAANMAVLSLLLAISGDGRPVLVVVDDAQWVDQASLGAFAFAAIRAGDEERLGFLFAQRSGSPCLLDHAPIQRLSLAGLDRDATVELLLAEGVTPAVAERCWRLTGGNPLALLDGVRGLSAAQRSGDAPLPPALPAADRLVETYEQRLLDLPERTRRALGVLAMESEDLAVALAALTTLGGTADDLLPAERSGIVVVEGGQVRWHHPLLRTAAHRLTVGESRRQVQRALAAALSAGGYHDRAVWHLSESVREPDEAIAAQLAELGAEARRRGAPAAAGQAYEAAARLSTVPGDRHHRIFLAAEAWWTTGDHGRATTLLRPLVAEVDDVATRAQMGALLGRADVWVAGPATATAGLQRLADEVLEQHPNEAVTLLWNAVAASLLRLDMPTARELAARAVVAAEAAADAPLQFGAAAIHTVTCIFDGASGDPAMIDALEALGRVAVAAVALDAPDSDMLAQLCAYGLIMCDRTEVAETLLREMIGLNTDSTMVGPRVMARLTLAEVLWRTGRWSASVNELIDLLSLQEVSGPRQLIPVSRAVYARVRAGCGDEAQCRAAVSGALEVASPLRLDYVAAVAHSAIGLLELGAGRHAAAAEAFDRVGQLTVLAKETGWLWWQGDAVEALAGAGRTDDARRSLDRLETMATETGRVWALGAVARAKGMLGEGGEPEAQFAQALERFRAIDAPFEEARTLLARGRYRRTQGQRDSGSQDLAAARRIFERRELGARPWSEQASAALVETETSLLARLTPAERDVAIAVAAGGTDEEVAEQLGIKRSTVRWHLSKSIYPKVGVHRRGELIALVLRERGDPP